LGIFHGSPSALELEPNLVRVEPMGNSFQRGKSA
jgi:hypothetical protein